MKTIHYIDGINVKKYFQSIIFLQLFCYVMVITIH
jgi:hypothetical protein